MTADQDVSVEFGVLGPLSAQVAGSPVTLQSAKTRVVLASLLLRPNRMVSVEELVDRLWDSNPPSGARNATQSYVMRLRKALGRAGALISTQPAGYLIEAAPHMVDLGRFRARIAAADLARSRSQATVEARELRAALAIWRGAPLSDVPSELLHVQEVQRLAEERLTALERLMDVELALGRHAEVIGELYTLTEENRLRERFWGQLMLALYRSDRQADALSAYRKVARLLREELGIDPAEALRELHQRILVSDRTTPAPRQQKTPAAGGWTAPHQLPAGVPDFIGRDDLVAQLRELTTRRGEDDHAVPIAILSGPPGAGKTALAVHAARRLRREFPDGVLWVNLRGYSASPPLAATDALGRFLRALGVSTDHTPHEVDEQSTLLRSLLSGRKVFMILDNAASPEHVRPLLPSDPSCAVLITSRNNLSGLTALNGARRFPVGMVSAAEATALIAKIVGTDRVAAEPSATAALAATCGFLPLSLRIAATNLADSSGLTIAEYVGQLRSGNRLDAMAIEGDDQAAVRLAFDLSYSTLKPALSRFFRMLSLIPGPDFDSLAAAAVADLSPAQAQRMLGQLAAANLIGDGPAGRFSFHDLIKEFAAERVQDQESAEEREQAGERLFAYYLYWANSASLYVYSDTHPVALPDLAPVDPVPEWYDAAAASGWLEREEENLVAMICTTPMNGLPVWTLADAMATYLQRGRHDSSWKSAFTSALAAAEHSGGPQAKAAAHRGLGRLQFHHTHYAEAETHLAQAVRLYQESGDTIGEARARNLLGAVAMETGPFEQAVEHFEAALRLADIDNDHDPAGRATTLFNLGLMQIHLGQIAKGTASIARCSELASEHDFRHLRPRCVAGIGLRDLWAGDLGPALRGFEQALAEWVNLDLEYTVGWVETMRNIADTALTAGFPAMASELARRALNTAQDIDWRWGKIGAHVVLGNSALALADIETAGRHFAEARTLADPGKSYWHWAIIRGSSEVCRRSGRLAEANELAANAIDAPLPRERAQVLTELAAILLAKGDHQGAVENAETAARIAQDYGHRIDRINALGTLALAHASAGDPAAAENSRTLAAEITEPVPAEIESILARLASTQQD
ncbi:MAG TPA: BTAD domain-containing putative transcriptional regulator [Pseudonocardiaceae bacterium]|nr:BTAD domain-containing putative transcriptional regulator [Pseudonocardiaceae bacterium]